MRKIALDDVVGVIGLVLMVAGVACWSEPAALILCGFMLFAGTSGLYMAAHRLLIGFVNRHGGAMRKHTDGDIRRAS